jgi:CRP-like cAMP-binding protein
MMMNISHPAFKAFADFFTHAIHPLDPGDTIISALAREAVLRTPAKADHILEAGAPADHIYFVYSGLIRYYYLDEINGEERTGQFFDANSVYTDVISFICNQPSRQYIQALEASEIVCIPRTIIYASYAVEHSVERFSRMMLEQGVVGSQGRTASFMTETLEERYRNFHTKRPEIAHRIPQYMIASYLGVTPEALSRVRRRSTQVERGV